MQRPSHFPVHRLSREAGLSLVETLIVLVIVGLVSAMIIPNVISRPDDARVTVARNDIAALAAALQLYRLDNGTYPSTAQGLSALAERPKGEPRAPNWHPEGYLDSVPIDPWGNPYEYRIPGRSGPFDLYSLGADGQQGGEGYDADVHLRETAS